MKVVSMSDVREWARRLAHRIEESGHNEYLLAGIPRGGIPVAYAIAAEMTRAKGHVISADELGAAPPIIEAPVILVDDIVVSGSTMKEAYIRNKEQAFLAVALVRKRVAQAGDVDIFVAANWDKTLDWLQFPWETRDDDLGKPEDAVRRLVEYLGEDPTEEDLLDTPKRVLRFYDELCKARDTEIVATTFPSTVQDFVVTSGIPFASLCRHHMLPYFGEAAIGYVPHGKILGLSKLPRAVQQAAGGLTVQEHLTAQVAEQVGGWADSADIAVVTTAVHSCMVIRGVKALGARTSASTMLGAFRSSAALRAEFFAVIGAARSLA